MTEKQVVVANQLVNYLSNEVVDPAAQTVVFLHGWRSEAAVWRPVMDRLGRRYRQFALDLPGFGKSEKPKHIFTLVDYATVVLGFIKKMELKKIVVVGHSFGGRVVIKLSALEPDIVEKLILVDSAGFRLHGKRNAVLRIVAKMLKPFFMIPKIHIVGSITTNRTVYIGIIICWVLAPCKDSFRINSPVLCALIIKMSK